MQEKAYGHKGEIMSQLSSASPAIDYIGATKTYRTNGKEFLALEPLHLRIERGEFFGLLGHNGAGKTTAINMLCGVVKPSGGIVKVNGLDVVEHPKTSKHELGVVPQEVYADSFFTLDTMLNIQSKLSGVTPDKEWIAFLLERLALSNHVKKTTRELSGGMKRRMMIARALVHKPKIIVLDEPTAGVDVELRHNMWEFVKELHSFGNTIILTTHYLEEAEQFCSRLAILKKGKLLTVKQNYEVLELGGKPKILFYFEKINLDFVPKLKEALQSQGLSDSLEIGTNSQKNELFVSSFFDAKVPSSLVEATQKLQQFVSSQGLTVARVATEEPTLEQVFLQLTRN